MTAQASKPNQLKDVQWIVGVASGKGGVGKSSVTAHLAMALKGLGLRVGVLDADIYGPSQGLMFGIAAGTRPATQDQSLFVPIEAHGVSLMSMAFLVTPDTPMVWRGPMASGALMQLLTQTAWGTLDVLLVDLPPGTGDIQLTLTQKTVMSGAIIVTTPQDIAVLDAKKAIEMFNKVKVPILGLIENMSYFQCQQCGEAQVLFGEGGAARLEQRYQSPVLARLPLHPEFGQACDLGQALDASSDVAVLFKQVAQGLMAQLNVAQAALPQIKINDDL